MLRKSGGGYFQFVGLNKRNILFRAQRVINLDGCCALNGYIENQMSVMLVAPNEREQQIGGNLRKQYKGRVRIYLEEGML